MTPAPTTAWVRGAVAARLGRAKGLGLRARLILAFLSIAMLVAASAGIGGVLLLRGQRSIAEHFQVATPLRIESAELRLTAQRMQVALLGALAGGTQDEAALDRQRARFEALGVSSRTALDRMRALAGRAGVALPLDDAAASVEDVLRLMSQMVEMHQLEHSARLAAEMRQDQQKAMSRELNQLLRDRVAAAEARIALAEQEARRGTEAGTATIQSLAGLLNATLGESVPTLLATERLMRAWARLDELVEAFLGSSDPATLATLEAAGRQALRQADAALHRLVERMSRLEDSPLLSRINDGLTTMARVRFEPDGVFAYHRLAVEAEQRQAAVEQALRGADETLAVALASTATLAEALEREAQAEAEQTTTRMILGLGVSALGGTLLAVLLGVVFTRRLLVPLSRLDAAVRGVSEGRLDARLEGGARGDEVDAMAATVLDRVAHLATHDTLTGLPNRALFRDRLDQALARARRGATTIAIHCIDLDRFKEVNDTLGHAAGDRLLAQVATRLSNCIRETDTLARLGGDEFAVVQSGARQPQDAESLARRMGAVLAEPFDLAGHQAIIGSSIGIAVRRGDEALVDPAVLLQEADLALYQAKEAGRGTWRFFEAAMNAKLQARKALEADLRRALAEGQFRLHYQPQFDLAGRVLVGAEALLRWDHPVRGTLPPDQFIPLAEETGLIGPIGGWALAEACRQAVAWPNLPRIAVNISVGQFRRSGFVALVERTLRETGLSPYRLELEVPEALLTADPDAVIAGLTRLRGLGVSIAIDDFGTGSSSLGTLRRFAFDRIKIDRSFVRGLGADREAMAIIRAVLGMSRALGIRTHAGGVEDEAQAAMLAGEGCEEVQGFLFGHPVSAAEFTALLPRFTTAPG